jgi:HK97 family phage portal protein
VVIAASEIIHDRGPCLFHPLVGVPPIFACGVAATQGNRIQSNSQQFFANLSRPGGVLSAPDVIEDETLEQLKTQFERDFSGTNLGRLLVVGQGMTYTAMSIPAQQAQLIEQLQWTAQDVARAFQMPLHKISTGAQPTFNNIAALNQDYYSQTLQKLIEDIELLLDEGLGLVSVSDRVLGVEFDLDGLLRMDPVQLAEVNEKGIKAGYLAPNEARARVNLPPVKGGEEPVMQQQNFPLSVLVKQPPPGTTAPAATPPADGPDPDGAPAPKPSAPNPDQGEPADKSMDAVEIKEFTDALIARLMRLTVDAES